MVSALPNDTIPLTSFVVQVEHPDEVDVSPAGVKQALSRAKKAIREALARIATTTDHEGNFDRSACAVLLKAAEEQLNTLERYEVLRKEWEHAKLSASRAKYMVVVLLLSTALMSTSFALFFLSSRK
jgi:hypothetical protein